MSLPENPHKKEKIIEVLMHAAAEFIQKESGPQSMITVTDVSVSDNFQKSTIFVTVFPDEKEKEAIDFLHRSLSELRDFVKSETRINNVPWFDFAIDKGEKSRQRLDEISKEIRS